VVSQTGTYRKKEGGGGRGEGSIRKGFPAAGLEEKRKVFFHRLSEIAEKGKEMERSVSKDQPNTEKGGRESIRRACGEAFGRGGKKGRGREKPKIWLRNLTGRGGRMVLILDGLKKKKMSIASAARARGKKERRNRVTEAVAPFA